MEANPFILKIATVLINPAIKGLFIIALLAFLWGVLMFVKNADDEAARTKGRNTILWGVVGMAIMVAAGGIIRIAIGTVHTIK
jgi:hypothetical protein